MNIKNNYFTISIFKSNNKEYKKLEKFVRYLNHLRNCFYIIALEEENIFGQNIILSNTYDTAKLGTIFNYKLSDKTTEMIKHIRSIKKQIGGVYTENIAHQVSRDIKSIIALRNNKQYSNLPKPKSFDKLNTFTFSVSQYSYKIIPKKKSNELKITLGSRLANYKTCIKIRIPKSLTTQIKHTKEIKLTWIKNIGYKINITYKIENQINYELNKHNFISIDLGYNNLLSIASNKLQSFIISGKPLLSFNHWLVEKISKLKNNYIQIKHLHNYGKKIRKTIINTIINKIIQLCIKNNIGTIYIGKLSGIFQTKSYNHNFNRSFRLINFGYLMNKLKYMCNYYNINLIEVNEYYTSQFSCLSDQIETGKKLTNTKRKKSSFKDRKFKITFHADINGAWNIAIKANHKIRKWILQNIKKVIKSLCNPIKFNYIPIKPESLNHIMGRVN